MEHEAIEKEKKNQNTQNTGTWNENENELRETEQKASKSRQKIKNGNGWPLSMVGGMVGWSRGVEKDHGQGGGQRLAAFFT